MFLEFEMMNQKSAAKVIVANEIFSELRYFFRDPQETNNQSYKAPKGCMQRVP